MAWRRGLPASAAFLCATPHWVHHASLVLPQCVRSDRSVARRLGAGTSASGLVFVGVTM